MSVYDTKPVIFISIGCNAIKWVQKKRQVYDPKTKMVSDVHFLSLNVNDYYNYNMNSFDLSDQLHNVHQVDNWVHKCKWWWYILFWVQGLVLVNSYIVLKYYVKRAS